MHAVRDIEESEPLVAQAFQHDKNLGHVRRRQRRGRLVENQDAGFARQRLGDLDHLPARKRQVLDERHRMDVRRPGPRERFFRDAPLGAPVDESEPARGIADRDVVGDRQVGDERQFLENADDSRPIGRGGGIERDLRAVKHDPSRVGPDDAGQDLDQRGLACAVFAEDRVDPACRDGEIGLLQGAHAAITLRHAFHAQDQRSRRLNSRNQRQPPHVRTPRRSRRAPAAPQAPRNRSLRDACALRLDYLFSFVCPMIS